MCQSILFNQYAIHLFYSIQPISNQNSGSILHLHSIIWVSMQFVVPSSAGTTGDQLARLISSKLSPRINAAIVVENKVGAGGLIGIDYVAKANPDGKHCCSQQPLLVHWLHCEMIYPTILLRISRQ
jgi:hypothetical protein